MTPERWMRSRRKQVTAIFVVLVVATSAAALLVACRRDFNFAKQHKTSKTRLVAVNMLPEFVAVPEEGYSHQFSIPTDATNAHVDGEFTVEPRPQGQLELLIVSAEGMQHWQRFVSSTASSSDSGDAALIYRSGDTIADRFNAKMSPGNYYVIFDYGPAAVAPSDHFGGDLSGPAYRQAQPQFILNYELPCETCP
jgi:hypothetical protein